MTCQAASTIRSTRSSADLQVTSTILAAFDSWRLQQLISATLTVFPLLRWDFLGFYCILRSFLMEIFPGGGRWILALLAFTKKTPNNQPKTAKRKQQPPSLKQIITAKITHRLPNHPPLQKNQTLSKLDYSSATDFNRANWCLSSDNTDHLTKSHNIQA